MPQNKNRKMVGEMKIRVMVRFYARVRYRALIM